MDNGFTQIPNSILVDSRLTPYEKIIYCVIRMHCIDKDNCWPSLTTISKESGASRPTVVSTIKKLESVGLITKTKEDGKDSNVYTIINKWLNNLTSKPALLVKEVNRPSKGDLLPLVKEVNSNNIKKNNIKEKDQSIEPTKKDKNADPRITGLFKHYHDEHLRVYGTKPYISGGKDGKIFKRMLEQLTATEIKERMTRFFSDPLDRLKDPHHTLPLFESMINRYSSNGYKPTEPQKEAYDPNAWFKHHVIMTPLIPSEQRFPYKVRASVYWDIFYSFTLRIYGEDYHENEEKVIKINRALIKEGKINGWEEDYYKITGRNPDTNVQYQV